MVTKIWYCYTIDLPQIPKSHTEEIHFLSTVLATALLETKQELGLFEYRLYQLTHLVTSFLCHHCLPEMCISLSKGKRWTVNPTHSFDDFRQKKWLKRLWLYWTFWEGWAKVCLTCITKSSAKIQSVVTDQLYMTDGQKHGQMDPRWSI